MRTSPHKPTWHATSCLMYTLGHYIFEVCNDDHLARTCMYVCMYVYLQLSHYSNIILMCMCVGVYVCLKKKTWQEEVKFIETALRDTRATESRSTSRERISLLLRLPSQLLRAFARYIAHGYYEGYTESGDSRSLLLTWQCEIQQSSTNAICAGNHPLVKPTLDSQVVTTNTTLYPSQ